MPYPYSYGSGDYCHLPGSEIGQLWMILDKYQ